MKKKKERRTYHPRILGSGKIMTPADLKHLHKYVMEIYGRQLGHSLFLIKTMPSELERKSIGFSSSADEVVE
jgi:hypothetical protein